MCALSSTSIEVSHSLSHTNQRQLTLTLTLTRGGGEIRRSGRAYRTSKKGPFFCCVPYF